ncbi:MAG: hypothetical protein M9894_14865 [Planctomycetes bacterium]|nr:hypothetical protein [Planctomycetota bacterium]
MDIAAPRPQPSPDLRCAYCHAPADGAAACPGCGTLVHDACRIEARGACPTIGCASAVVVDVKPDRGEPGRWEAFVNHPAVQAVASVLMLFAPFAGLAFVAWFLTAGLNP